MEEWWTERVDVAKYAQIPLGNLGVDVPCDIADVFFARKLQDQNHVLWVSPTKYPDLGGGASEANQLLAEPVTAAEISAPGAYRSICVELKLSGVPVNALMKQNLLDELDGIQLDVLGAEDTAINKRLSDEATQHVRVTPKGYENERAACSHTMRILRNVVQGWMVDMAKTGNEFADMLLMHFYRWMHTDGSMLHDPSLHRVTHTLMQHLFQQLVTELQQLGAKLVFASEHSVILCTDKTTVEQAEGYVAYILEALKGNELFDFVDITAGRTWQSLLWMDKANFGGLQLTDDETENGDGLQVESNWNIGEYLPAVTINDFLVLISEFIYMPLRSEESEPRCGADGQSIPTLREHFAPNFLTILNHISRTDLSKMDQDEDLDDENPDSDRTASTALQLELLRSSGAVQSTSNNPALEFAKYFCHVLSLDPQYAHDAMLLRRSALKMLHVREFSTEAQFANPCVSFTLQNWVSDL